MTPYASNTGGKTNLAQLKHYGWRLLLTPDNPQVRAGFKYAVDNGAWGAFQKQESFDESRFMALVERAGAGADFVILPDIVAGGNASLNFSIKWYPKLRHLRMLMLPVQDGMDVERAGAFIRHNHNVGIFLGGSTEYKLAEMYAWGLVAAALGRWYHVGRVNSARRIKLCAEAGAHSFDGTSATKFSSTVPLLDWAARRTPLFSARNFV